MKRRLFILILIAGIVGAVYYNSYATPDQIVLTGIVTTDDVVVSAQIQGRVQQLLVKQGDLVKRGDLVAVIQPDQWKVDMDYFKSAQQQAASEVTQAQAQLRLQEQQTQNQINQAEANLAAAQAEVAQGEADLESARLSNERISGLYERAAETAMARDQAKAAFDSNKAHVEALRKQVQSAEAALAMAKSNVEQVAARKAMLEAQTQKLAASEAQKDKAQVQLNYTEIRAPLDGVVDVRAALQGEVVNPAQAIITLINQDDLWVRADVEETYIDRIHIGDNFTVKLPSGATRDGTVFFRGVDAGYATQRDVSRTKRDIKTFEVRLRCDNADRSLAVGMTAYVVLPLK